MPFTTSHPAVIFPIKRLWPHYFSLTGLIAGAMSPDFIYFVLLRTAERGISHSWDGLFLFCLPAGLLFCFVFHWLFKEEFINHLPRFLKTRMEWLLAIHWHPSGIREWGILIISVLVGSLSHFFWDSWTHGAGEMTKIFPWLLSSFTLLGRHIRTFEILHHISSVIGAFYVIRLLLSGRALSSSQTHSNQVSFRQKLFFQLGGILSAILLMALVVNIHWHNPGSELRLLFGYKLSYISVGLASWTGYISYVCVRGAIRLVSMKRKTATQKT